MRDYLQYIDRHYLALNSVYNSILPAQPGRPLTSSVALQCLVVKPGKLPEFAGAVTEHDILPQLVFLEHLRWELSGGPADSMMFEDAPHY